MQSKLELSPEQNVEQIIMTEIAVLTEQVKTLTKHIDELKSDIRELKDIQAQKIVDLEKRTALLEEKVNRLNWIINLVIGVIITGITGGLLSLILK